MREPIVFTYQYRDEFGFYQEIDNLPYRIGDKVTIKDWGKSYSGYSACNFYFKGNHDNSYFSEHKNERTDDLVFKIYNMACHPFHKIIVLYLKDNLGRDSIIGHGGVALVKQLPLRIGEKTVIKLEKLKS